MKSTETKMVKQENDFLLSKIIFWTQFIFFGGWNGIQILLQPQDLSVFVVERGLIDNFFFTLSYAWMNIPLIYLILVAIAVFWNYSASSLDLQLINSLKKKDDIAVIPYKDRDNIVVFITTINIAIWIVALSMIYLIPYWNLDFLTDLFYNVAGTDKVKEPLYILIIIVTASINLLLRIQFLLFYEGGYEYTAISKFFASAKLMKTHYVKAFMLTLLATTLTSLIYKQFILEFVLKLRSILPDNIIVNLHLMVNRVDIISAIPSIILMFLLSCLFFSPLVIYVYRKIVKSQYEFFKQQYLKQKQKKDIDEYYQSVYISENEI